MFGEVKNPEGVGNIYIQYTLIWLMEFKRQRQVRSFVDSISLWYIFQDIGKKLDIIRTILIYSDERNS